MTGWGRWEFDGPEDEIRFEGDDGGAKTYRSHPLLRPLFRDVWKNLRNGVALILDHGGNVVYRFTCDDGEIREAATIDRPKEMDCGLAFCHFVETDDKVLLVYESGLDCFSAAGQLIWKVDGLKYDSLYAGLEPGLVIYESEHSGRWAYRLDSGDRIDT